MTSRFHSRERDGGGQVCFSLMSASILLLQFRDSSPEDLYTA